MLGKVVEKLSSALQSAVKCWYTEGDLTKKESSVMSCAPNYRRTLYASYTGYITQAIVNSFAPLLFLTFQSALGIPLERITLLVTLNFGVQLCVDLLSTKFVDRIGYRPCIIAANLCSALGLIGLGTLPFLLPDPYVGLLCSVVLYAIGGGLLEVLVSPIVEACPFDNKAGVMATLHSFYCWGCVLVALVSTGFFALAGIGHWNLLACLWALVPIANLFVYAGAPIPTLVPEGEGMKLRELLRSGVIWLFFLLMVCAGASEQGMSQWASAFAEAGLHVSKTIGDLAGPCMFSLLMGTARAVYGKYSEKWDLAPFMLGSSVLCIVSYLLATLSPAPLLGLVGCGLCGFSVGILWPGTFSLVSAKCPRGGTAMFALMALGGDLGCSSGPTLVGLVTSAVGEMKAGLLAAIVFPVVMIAGLLAVKRMK